MWIKPTSAAALCLLRSPTKQGLICPHSNPPAQGPPAEHCLPWPEAASDQRKPPPVQMKWEMGDLVWSSWARTHKQGTCFGFGWQGPPRKAPEMLAFLLPQHAAPPTCVSACCSRMTVDWRASTSPAAAACAARAACSSAVAAAIAASRAPSSRLCPAKAASSLCATSSASSRHRAISASLLARTCSDSPTLWLAAASVPSRRAAMLRTSVSRSERAVKTCGCFVFWDPHLLSSALQRCYVRMWQAGYALNEHSVLCVQAWMQRRTSAHACRMCDGHAHCNSVGTQWTKQLQRQHLEPGQGEAMHLANGQHTCWRSSCSDRSLACLAASSSRPSASHCAGTVKLHHWDDSGIEAFWKYCPLLLCL